MVASLRLVTPRPLSGYRCFPLKKAYVLALLVQTTPLSFQTYAMGITGIGTSNLSWERLASNLQ